jgi:hypothetical protein
MDIKGFNGQKHGLAGGPKAFIRGDSLGILLLGIHSFSKLMRSLCLKASVLHLISCIACALASSKFTSQMAIKHRNSQLCPTSALSLNSFSTILCSDSSTKSADMSCVGKSERLTLWLCDKNEMECQDSWQCKGYREKSEICRMQSK